MKNIKELVERISLLVMELQEELNDKWYEVEDTDSIVAMLDIADNIDVLINIEMPEIIEDYQED